MAFSTGTPVAAAPNPCNSGSIWRAPIVLAAADGVGPHTIVALTASKRIVVLRVDIKFDTDTILTWKSNTTVIKGGQPELAKLPPNGDNYCEKGLFETVAGQDLNLLLGTAATGGGTILYVLVD